MSIFTNEDERRIIDMYQNNISIDDIIEYFNTQEHDIRMVLKCNSIDRKYNYFSDELYKRIETLYNNKRTCKDIANSVLISETSVTKILKKRGIRIRTYSENNRRYSLNEHYFDKIDTQNKAYILGILWADGCNHVPHHSITLQLQEEDYDVVSFVKKELGYGGPIQFIKRGESNPKHKNAYKLCINSEYMSNKLNEIGMVNAKSLILKFPECMPDKFYPHFIRGYFDGDGCISYDEKRQKCCTKTAGTKEMCCKLSEILSDIGCKHHIIHPKQCKDSNTFIIQTGGNKSSLLLLDYMYDNDEFHMDRKYQKYLYFKEKYLYKNNTQVA